MITQPQLLLLMLALTLLGSTTMADRADNSISQAQQQIAPVGLFIGSIEEGARIFTPIRLLPFEHPDSEGHEFPNALQLHQSEYEALVWLGDHIGLKLAATLQRYPRPPAQEWWYEAFDEVPAEIIKTAPVHRKPGNASPIPGLKAVVFYEGQAICFIVDTRGLTLAERGMERPTTMGLDLTREQFLEGLAKAGEAISGEKTAVVIFEG